MTYRANIAFILADEVTKINSKHRQAGLLMTRALVTPPRRWAQRKLVDINQYNTGVAVSLTELAVRKMIPVLRTQQLDEIVLGAGLHLLRTLLA